MPITITGTTFTGGTTLVGFSTSIQAVTNNLVLNLDAAAYSGSGNWIDTVGSKAFVLNGSPSYSSTIGGGSFNFSPASGQSAFCSTSLSSLNTWTVEAWNYYDGTNTGLSPCIITEGFGGTLHINYALGAGLANPNVFESGFFGADDGVGWRTSKSGSGYATSNLVPGTWYQFVGTYNGSNIKLYINNTLIESTAYSAPGGYPQSAGSGIRLMQKWDGDAQYWGGKLGIVRVYNTDIGTGGINQNWSANKSRFGL